MSLLLPDVGRTAHFTFKEKFNALNGIYKLTEVKTYDSAIAENISLKDAYIACGLTAKNFEDEHTNYLSDKVIELVSVTDTSRTLYVAVTMLAMVPNISVNKYRELVLGVHLGVFDNPDKLNWLRNLIDDAVSTVTGTTKTVKMVSADVKWMTEDEYRELDLERQARIDKLDTLTEDKNALIKENNQLKDKLAATEELLVQLVKE